MSKNSLSQQLSRYDRWRSRQLRVLAQLEPWLKQQGLYTADAQRALRQARLTLSSDQIRIAVVGEFSRGKTELINALFFADFGDRLLPSDAGRTTMCPTEVFQDDKSPPYLEVLPIETRADEIGLVDLMQKNDAWHRFALDTSDNAGLRRELMRIKEVQDVSLAEAERLGLSDAPSGSTPGSVVIPKWRMARINHRHPLLAEGLRILDTPGLNTIGSEPELTYEILPSSQVKLFLLATDTGVTRSDREIWDRLIRIPGDKGQRGLIVVLNKMDVLWDDLRSPEEILGSIEQQRLSVARTLELDPVRVFATSAQKALVARIRHDAELEEKSGIQAVEGHLAQTMVHDRQTLVREQSVELVRGTLSSLEALVNSRLKRMEHQIESLNQLSTKSDAAIDTMLKGSIRSKERYQINLAAYKESRDGFQDHGLLLLEALSPLALEDMTERARQQMIGAWTTPGLKAAMGVLFDEIHERMMTAGTQSQEMRKLIRGIYRRFRKEHGFVLADPSMFSIVSHQVELNLVRQEAEIFRNSPRSTLTEQHLLVKRYFQTMVRRTQEIFHTAYNQAKDWLETAMDPLTMQIHEHRKLLNDELEGLRQAGQSRATVRQRIQVLKTDCGKLNSQISSLRAIHQALGATRMPRTTHEEAREKRTA